MKTALVIYNPMSGLKSWKDVPRIVQDELNKNDYQYVWFETQKVKSQPLNQFLEKRFDRIIAIGGDGTVAEVASFMMKHKIKTPLVIIPQGSANVLAASLGLPLLNVRRAIRIGLTKPGKSIDLMQVNKRFSGLIAVGQGYDVMIMKTTTRNLKRQLGLLAYGLSFLKTFLFYRGQPYKLTIDNERHHVVAKTVLVFNILPIPHFKIGEKVKPNDGKLNVLVFNPRTLWDLFKRSPRIQTFTGKKIVIKSKKEREFDIDGDIMKGNNVQIEVIPKAINIVYTKSF